jgi:hypothetical protein
MDQRRWEREAGLRDLGRELRERVGGEFRSDAEEGERQAAQASARRRTLAEVAADLRSRGDTVAVSVGRQVLTGTIVFAGSDYLRLRTPGALVDCPLTQPLVLRVVQRARAGGTGLSPGSGTFRARLLELEVEAVEVQLGTSVLGDVQRGRLRTVARDHVVFVADGGQEWHVALAAVTCVARRWP